MGDSMIYSKTHNNRLHSGKINRRSLSLTMLYFAGEAMRYVSPETERRFKCSVNGSKSLSE